jgi:hypothetical protein
MLVATLVLAVFVALLLAACVVLYMRQVDQESRHRELVAQIQWIVDHGGGLGNIAEAEVEGDLLWQDSADWIASSRANKGW